MVGKKFLETIDFDWSGYFEQVGVGGDSIDGG